MGVVFLAAWVLVGIPLAIAGLRFSSVARVILVYAVSGLIGVVFLAVIIEPRAILHPGGPGVLRVLFSWKLWLLLFPSAAISMLVYTGIRPMVEQFPLEDAARAYERMLSNQVRFRAVLVNA